MICAKPPRTHRITKRVVSGGSGSPMTSEHAVNSTSAVGAP